MCNEGSEPQEMRNLSSFRVLLNGGSFLSDLCTTRKGRDRVESRAGAESLPSDESVMEHANRDEAQNHFCKDRDRRERHRLMMILIQKSFLDTNSLPSIQCQSILMKIGLSLGLGFESLVIFLEVMLGRGS